MPISAKEVTWLEGKKMQTRMIDSSNVVWVAWPQGGEPLMLVKYRGNEIYGYVGVSRQRAVAAAHAPSTGKYINERVKPHFEAVRINA
jgi:hypothetical protein